MCLASAGWTGEQISQVDPPSDQQPHYQQQDLPDYPVVQKRSVEREVVPRREFRGNPPVPRWAHQGAGGFMQFSGEEDSGCASLDRSSVSPQPGRNKAELPQQQQQPIEEEERDACSFMWFDLTPPVKKPSQAEVVRRQKKVNDVAAVKKRATNRHSAPPGTLDFIDVTKSVTSSKPRVTSQRNDIQPKPTSELKRRRSTTTLNVNNSDKRKTESQSRFIKSPGKHFNTLTFNTRTILRGDCLDSSSAET